MATRPGSAASGSRFRAGGYLPMALMLAAGAVLVHALATATVLVAIARGDAVGDWMSTYAAGEIVRAGQGRSLYELATQAAMQHALFGVSRTGVFPLPPFVALAVAPLARLSFGTAFFLWGAVNLAALATVAYGAWWYLAGVRPALRIAFVACAALSTPVVDTLLLGQFDLFVLISMGGCYLLLRRGRPFTAGAVLALALIEPYVVAAAVLLLLLKREWRALAGFAAAGAPLLLLPALALGPGMLLGYARLLVTDPGSSAGGMGAAEMINVRGAVTSITGSSGAWLWAPPLAVIAAASLVSAVRAWSSRPAADAQSWALALVLPLLYSPHVHLQTMVLALAAACLFVRAAADAGRPPPVETVVLAYALIAGLWLLSLAGLALMFLPLLLSFRTLLKDWPAAAAPAAEDAGPAELPLAS